MASTLVIHAHPRPSQSIVTQSMLRMFEAAGDTEIRPLYELYPDFDIDVATEQKALSQSSLVVWLAPVYWYSVPALLKHWMDQVLAYGWAYGPGGDALQGKSAWLVMSAGGTRADYSATGVHQRPAADFVPPLEQTARFCGMRWMKPHIEYGGHDHSRAELASCTHSLEQQLANHLADYRDALALAASQAEGATP
jgi:glutathione-regulated potassium-efflux system ancillary protein KefF